MTSARLARWLLSLFGVGVLVGALAGSAAAAPPPWSPPGATQQPATQIAICCTWGHGLDDGISYSIVGTTDPTTISAISDGFNEWATALGHGLHFDLVSSGGEVTVRVKRGGGTTAGSTGRTFDGNGFITGASMSLSGKAFGQPADLQPVAAHEWGHVLGVDHANGTGELMSPVLSPSITTPQPCDIDAANAALAWFLDGNPGTGPGAVPSSVSC